MSFQINGETWQPKTAEEHASAIIEAINTILAENNILDSNGNTAKIKESYGNALYLLALGDGQRFEQNDASLSNAINSLNVDLCDDEQIENLLPIAAISRNPGSYSTLILTVKAEDEQGCFIPAGTKAPYEDVNFVVQEDVLLTAGATQNIETVCDTIGPVAVLTGEVTSFDVSISGLESVTNPQSSVPGTAAETTNSLRRRISRGDTIKYSLDGVKNALEALTGVNYARVYFNYNNDSVILLPGNVEVQPRTAYIVIHGSSDKIAQVYCEYMNAPTQNAPGATTTAHSAEYVTQSGQIIPIYYDTATEQKIYVKVMLAKGADASSQVSNQIKRDLILASAQWKLGEKITSLATDTPFVSINYTEVAYTLVSVDGLVWTNQIEVGCNVMPRVTDDSITILVSGV